MRYILFAIKIVKSGHFGVGLIIIEKAKKSTKDDENETIKLVITNREIDKSIFLKKKLYTEWYDLGTEIWPPSRNQTASFKKKESDIVDCLKEPFNISKDGARSI